MLFQGVVPCLGHAVEVVRGEPETIGSECPLAPKELLALREPIQGILHAIVLGKVQLAETGNAQPGECTAGRRD